MKTERFKEMAKICAIYLSSMSRSIFGFPMALRRMMLSAYIRSLAEYLLPPLVLSGDINYNDAVSFEWSLMKNFLKLPH